MLRELPNDEGEMDPSRIEESPGSGRAWPIRPATAIEPALSFGRERSETRSLALDPGWAWIRLADRSSERPSVWDWIARAGWWRATSDRAAEAIDRLWRHGVAASMVARRLALKANLRNPHFAAGLGLIHSLGYWLVAIDDPESLADLLDEPNLRRRARLEIDLLGADAQSLALEWARSSSRHPDLLAVCECLGNLGSRSTPLRPPGLLPILTHAKAWADRTRWGGAGAPGARSDGRVERLERSVEAACSQGFLASPAPEPEALVRALARAVGECDTIAPERARFQARFEIALGRLRRLERDFERELATENRLALAEFAAGAGHELNNPLAVIQGRAQMLLARAGGDAKTARDLRAIIEQTQRAHAMIRDLMGVARPPELSPAPAAPSAFLKDALDALEPFAREREVAVAFEDECPQDAQAMVDGNALREIAQNLAMNAIEASPRGAEVKVAAKLRSNMLVWSFRNAGEAIEPKAAKRLFDPFFCGRDAGRGMGMGLPRAATIVRAMGGSIRWKSNAQGTVFQVRLPWKAPAPEE